MIFYGSNLNEYLLEGQESENVLYASTIEFTGLDWMIINATGNLRADTILVVIDSVHFDFEDIEKINVAENEMIDEIYADKLILSLGESHISNAPQIESIDFSSSHITLDQVSYETKTKKLDYANPFVEIEAEGLMYKNRKIGVAKLSYTEEVSVLEGVYFAEKSNQFIVDLKKITIQGNVLDIRETKKIETLSIVANKIDIPENFTALLVDEKVDLSIAKIKFNSPTVDFYKEGGSAKIASLQGVFADVSDVELSSRKEKISYKYYDLTSSSVTFSDVKDFTVKTGQVSIKPKGVTVNNLLAVSKKSRSHLAVNRHKRNTIYDFSCSSIQLEGDVIATYIETQQVIADKAIVSEAKVIVYTDMNADVTQRPKKIFSQLFKEFEVPVDIRVVELRNNYVKYDLRAERRTDNGSIHFSNINGTISNVTNIPVRLKTDPMIRSNFTAILMDKGKLDMSMNFNMIDTQNSYDYRSRLVDLEFQDVNRMLEDLSAMRIKKGEFDELLIDVKANKYRSQGAMEFYYRNLKIEYVEERTTGIVDPFRLLVNNFVLRQNNRKSRNPKLVKVDVMHDIKHSTFKRTWETVFDGLQKTLLPKVPKVPKSPLVNN